MPTTTKTKRKAPVSPQNSGIKKTGHYNTRSSPRVAKTEARTPASEGGRYKINIQNPQKQNA
jgi:hypothetical protein